MVWQQSEIEQIKHTQHKSKRNIRGKYTTEEKELTEILSSCTKTWAGMYTITYCNKNIIPLRSRGANLEAAQNFQHPKQHSSVSTDEQDLVTDFWVHVYSIFTEIKESLSQTKIISLIKWTGKNTFLKVVTPNVSGYHSDLILKKKIEAH